MPELSKLTAKDAEKLLLQNNFVIDRQKGSHKNLHKKFTQNGFVAPFGQNFAPKNCQTTF